MSGTLADAAVMSTAANLLCMAYAQLEERHRTNVFTAFEFGYAIRDLPGCDNELTLATALIAGRWVAWRPRDDMFKLITLEERHAKLRDLGANTSDAMTFESMHRSALAAI